MDKMKTSADEQRALDDEQTLLKIFEHVKNKWHKDGFGHKMQRLLECYGKGLPYIVAPPTDVRPQIIEYIKTQVDSINHAWDKHRRLGMLSNRAGQGAKHSLQFFTYPKGDTHMGRVKEFMLNHNQEELSAINEEQKRLFGLKSRKRRDDEDPE